jgi:Tol biopolymer transport system component
LFAAQKDEWNGGKAFGIPGFGALPGFGVHDDIWIATADAKEAWRLTDAPNVETEGELLPVVSPDGRRVAWSSRQPDKSYVLEIADLALTPEPHLQNVKAYLPGGAAYYEAGCFTSDGASLIYTSDQASRSFWRSQIHRLDLQTGKSERLSFGDDYNEHPTVVKTPTGDWIVYMSTKGVDRFPGRLMLGTDWWAMRLDGSGAKRLTRMNVNRPGNPQNAHDMRVATTVAPSPTGAFVLGDMQDSLVRQTGLVKVVRFVCE